LLLKIDSLSGTPFDVLSATASDLRQLLQDGKVTSVQIVDEYQRRIEKYNDKLHAIVCMPSNLADVAQVLDDERRQGTIRGPLHGIPIIVKVENAVTMPEPVC
jgi:amidase